jgi:hypothetical protein
MNKKAKQGYLYYKGLAEMMKGDIVFLVGNLPFGKWQLRIA